MRRKKRRRKRRRDWSEGAVAAAETRRTASRGKPRSCPAAMVLKPHQVAVVGCYWRQQQSQPSQKDKGGNLVTCVDPTAAAAAHDDGDDDDDAVGASSCAPEETKGGTRTYGCFQRGVHGQKEGHRTPPSSPFFFNPTTGARGED